MENFIFCAVTLNILFILFILMYFKSYLFYVGETALLFHKKINIYRKAKSGFECMINHFRNGHAGSSSKF